MSVVATVAGAPFFFEDGDLDGLAPGVSPASGVTVGLEEGARDSAAVGVDEGEGLCFFFREERDEASGAGGGEDVRFFFGEPDALDSDCSSGMRLAEAFFFFEVEGDGDFSGEVDGFSAGDSSASSFSFGAVELLRCFRGAGVGDGAKIFLILLPNDSSACIGPATPRSIAIRERAQVILLARRMERESSTGAGDQ